jgi:hypothetical protein
MTNSLFDQLRGCRLAALNRTVLALIPAGEEFPKGNRGPTFAARRCEGCRRSGDPHGGHPDADPR